MNVLRYTQVINEVCTEKRSQLKSALVGFWNWIVSHHRFMSSLFQSCVSVILCRSVKSHPVLSAQRNLGVQFHLECTYIRLVYFDYKPAKEHIQRAQQLCGLNISMTGGLVEGGA